MYKYMQRMQACGVCTSMACWKMAGVVSEEKVMILEPISSDEKRLRNWFMVDVLAVPGPPTSSDACHVQWCISTYKYLHPTVLCCSHVGLNTSELVL